jgi:hypothetical protein
VLIGDRRWDFSVRADGIEYWLTAPDGKKLLVESGWKPGNSLCIARVDGRLHHVKLAASPAASACAGAAPISSPRCCCRMSPT